MRRRSFAMGTVVLSVAAAMSCAACASQPVAAQHGTSGSVTPGSGTVSLPPPLGQAATAVVGTTRVLCPTQRWIPAANGAVTVPGGVRAIVSCTMVQRRYPGLGTWDVELAEVADSGLGRFVFALAHPPPPPSVVPACPANIELEPWFAVVSNDGNQTRPGPAPGICGWPDGPSLTLFHELEFRVVDAVRTQQVASAAASTTNGCPLQWQDTVATVGDGFAIDQVFAVADGSQVEGLGAGSSALACTYRAGPLVGGVRNGSLLGGAPLPDLALANSVAGFEAPNSFYQCPGDASTFATLTFQGGGDAGGVGYVELDSCHRAVATNGGFGTATDEFVNQLNTLTQRVPPAAPPT